MAVGTLGPSVGGANGEKALECLVDIESGVPVGMLEVVVEEGSIEREVCLAGDIAELAIRFASRVRGLKIRLDNAGDLVEDGVDMAEIEALFDHLYLAIRYAEMGVKDVEEIVAPET